MAFSVCSVGFCHDDWVGGFYPEEMPQAWWLDFYANFSEGVLITETDLQSLPETWLESVEAQADFAFYLSDGLAEGVQQRLQQLLGAQVAGALGGNYTQKATDCWCHREKNDWIFITENVHNLRDLKTFIAKRNEEYLPNSAVYALKGDARVANLLQQTPTLLTLMGLA